LAVFYFAIAGGDNNIDKNAVLLDNSDGANIQSIFSPSLYAYSFF